ncbi:Rne/Rng family ribonuclease [Candidatus Electrothrix sp.]|uniref:Rne/Rng family ribonuclease n=3 Tax=Candidatus Electrothrix sp. TaxID=2170559 RepID=UPI0040561537
MTNETENTTKEQQQTIKVRTVCTGAWWKSAKPKKAAQTQQTEQTKRNGEKKTNPPVSKKQGQTSKALSGATENNTSEKQDVSPEQLKQPAQKAAAESPKEVKKPLRSPKRQDRKPTPAKQHSQQVQEEEKKEQETKKSKETSSEQTQPRKDKKDSKNKNKQKATPEREAKTEGQEKETKQQKNKKVRLLINAEEPEECRIAHVEDGRLESFHVNTVVREHTKNNIYKGRIVSIEANLQSAFVEIGTGRNGFLPFNDIHPEYYREDISEQTRTLINQQQWKKLKIEDVVKRGQEVLVQVVKEVTGNKGANMTTYLSLPGRCLVLMPGSDSAGISRKISGEQRRSRLREIMSGFNIPEGVGYIVRTASAEITKTALQQDLRYLTGLWTEIKKRGQTSPAPALIYEDQDTVLRFLRDHFTQDIQEIVVDTEESYNQVSNFIDMLPARQKKVQVRLHRGVKPIFNQNNIEEQIESIYQPQVQLPSGGSIVINPTEALVAIDVNSGRTSQKGNFEKSIFLANMEAAEELARQLRLRDLGGLIVVDFIDMRSKNNIKELERQVKNAMKRDKAKVDISRISRFGLMQISRQKMGAPIEKGSYHRCDHCDGRGLVRSVETLALYYLRRIQTGVARKKINRVEACLPLEVGQYLLNKKRTELMELENKHQATISILPSPEMKPSENNIRFLS